MKLVMSLAAMIAIGIVGVAIAQEKVKPCEGTCPASEKALTSAKAGEGTCPKCCDSVKAKTLVSTESGEAAACCSKSKSKCCASDKTLASAKSCDSCEGEGCSACAEKSCDGECPISAALAKLPKMTYKVGTESTCCPKSAKALAAKSEAPVEYVVADKTYDDEHEAMVALVEKTESYVNAYITPEKCEKSGKTTVAGKSCSCPIEAGKRADLVKNAISKIKMTYKVGDEEVCCSKMASELAEKSGDATHYVVNGEETSCDLTARLNLATAKYKAAVEAISAVDQTAVADTSDKETVESGS